MINWQKIPQQLLDYVDAAVIQAGALILGETAANAYRGDRGKTAYDHSQTVSGNPHGTAIGDISTLQDSLDAKQATIGKDATGGYAGLTLFKINFKNAANTFTSFFTNANTAARTYTFQDRNGTIADDTDLGNYQATSGKDATGGYAGLTLFKINFKNAADTFTSFFTNANTAARTYTFPDKNLTVAGIVDIPTFPMGEVAYFNTTGTTITIAAQSDGSTNMVVVNPATAGHFHFETDNGGANDGRLRYTGAASKMFHCAVSLTVSPATNNDSFVLGIAKNGTVDSDCKALQKMGTTTDVQSTALHCAIELANNDYVELYIGNTTAGRNIIVKALNIFVMGVA